VSSKAVVAFGASGSGAVKCPYDSSWLGIWCVNVVVGGMHFLCSMVESNSYFLTSWLWFACGFWNCLWCVKVRVQDEHTKI